MTFLLVDVKDFDIADDVDLAKRVTQEAIALPQSVKLEWTGHYKIFGQAKAQLTLLAPSTLAIIFLMPFLDHGSIGEPLIILLTMPFSLTGAAWLLYALYYNLSGADGGVASTLIVALIVIRPFIPIGRVGNSNNAT